MRPAAMKVWKVLEGAIDEAFSTGNHLTTKETMEVMEAAQAVIEANIASLKEDLERSGTAGVE